MGSLPSHSCAVILAGGKGTRLASVAASIPKVLVPVGGRPVLAHQLELLQSKGYRDVRIFAGHMADQIVSFINCHSWPDLSIQIEIESSPLGSAGAVIEKLDTLPKQFTVLYGDTMLAVDFGRMLNFHGLNKADITLLVHPNDHPFDSDLVEMDSDHRVTAFHLYPHPEHSYFRNMVSAALYVVNRESLRPWAGQSEQCDFAKDVFPKLLSSGGSLFAYRSQEYVKDMGTPSRLARVEHDFQAGRIDSRHQRLPQPVVFLDRDGTINEEAGHISSPDNLRLLPRVASAIRSLRAAGFRVMVITNQPVVARGEATEADLAAVHKKLEWELGLEGAYVDAIYYCPHHPDAGFAGERRELKRPCECRKPATGMLAMAAEQMPIDISRSWMIGDTTVDLEFARRAGLQSILLQTGCAGKDGKYPDATPKLIAANLAQAADLIYHQSKRKA